MLLARLLSERRDELAADLMEVYGICLDEAMEGRYGASFVASLAYQLPQSCRWRVSYDEDLWWDGERLLMATLVNSVRALMWGMGDRKKRGPRPKPIGPRSLTKGKVRALPAMAMKRSRLLEELAKPREEVRDG